MTQRSRNDRSAKRSGSGGRPRVVRGSRSSSRRGSGRSDPDEAGTAAVASVGLTGSRGMIALSLSKSLVASTRLTGLSDSS